MLLLAFFLLASGNFSTCSDDYSGDALLGAGFLEEAGLGSVFRGVWRDVLWTVFFFLAGLSTVSFSSGKIGAEPELCVWC